VRLRLGPLAQRLLPHVVDTAAANAALAEAQPSEPPGWVELSLAVESEAVAHTQLVALGDGVEVLAPPSLRAALAETGRAMAALNGPSA
jgi:predicted DNA-binding transcriptional regulator YafY